MLHITNGDSAGDLLKATNLIPNPTKDLIVWRDVLEEGPTPADLSLGEMSGVRAQFISDRGWGTYEEVLEKFSDRNQQLYHFHDHDEVVWWFEHDLHDQLHIAQSFDWLVQQEWDSVRLSLICIDAFSGIAPFRGLGQLSPAQLMTLFPKRQSITSEHLHLGQAAWRAYCSADPRAIERWLERGIASEPKVLPFMRTALGRHLEEFPAIDHGLSRTEHQILALVHTRVDTPAALFRQNMALENALFLGDWSIWNVLKRLNKGDQALLSSVNHAPFQSPWECADMDVFKAQRFQLTEMGESARLGTLDWFKRSGQSYWRGGVHLGPGQPDWRWDRTVGKLVLIDA